MKRKVTCVMLLVLAVSCIDILFINPQKAIAVKPTKLKECEKDPVTGEVLWYTCDYTSEDECDGSNC